MLWTAFLIGLSSSFHCAGMCGPIALAVGGQKRRYSSQWLTGRIMYNVGRTTTYMLLGGVLGIIGQGFVWSGMQQGLSIILGASLLLVVLIQGKTERAFMRWPWLNRMLGRLRASLGKLLRCDQIPAMYHLGMLNGFLPCGMVYVALAAALTQPDLLQSIGFMGIFGLGTMPVMLSLSLGGPLLGQKLRKHSQRVMQIATMMVGVLLILRGMDLGIPFISPDLNPETGIVNCH